MKKLLNIILAGVFTVVGLLSFMVTEAAVFKPLNDYDGTTSNSTTDINLTGTGAGQQDSLINVIKGGINWVLGILALIALIILLWGGFQMVTAVGDDEKYKKGFTILKQAAMGLLLIGIAWFIITMIFWLVSVIAPQSLGGGGTGG